jgi:membrane fusion protein, copper/silver efflux system
MKRKVLYLAIAVGAGIFLGWLFFHSPGNVEEKHELTTHDSRETIWTCAMHPHIRMSEPGKCPICGMELIPLKQINSPSDSSVILLSEEAMQLANVSTSLVSHKPAFKEIRLYGKVQADERMMQSQVAHVPGRIEKLLVNFNGERVIKGQVLALIYSPELITAQQELFEALKTKQTHPDIFEAAREKLRQLKLTEKQIEEVEISGTVQNNIEVVSNTTGIVSAVRIKNGDYISSGSVMYEVADLSHLWLMFDAYESDLEFLNKGDKLSFTVQALPGKKFSGNIAFIDPFINPLTRVARVRVEVTNESGRLKPEMFATGIISANLSEYRNNLVVPRSAVLWTGKRSIVYVKQPGTEPVFKLRDVELGPTLGDNYVIVNGLTEGEEIVTRGAFSVDAASQLEGKPSMMNPVGVKTSAMPGMDMSDASVKDEYLKEITSNKQLTTTTVGVSGNCEMCKERIEKAALSVSGVSNASWDLNTKKLNVDFDNRKANPEIIQRAIANKGHDTEMFRADDEVYKALPECCLYRK